MDSFVLTNKSCNPDEQRCNLYYTKGRYQTLCGSICTLILHSQSSLDIGVAHSHIFSYHNSYVAFYNCCPQCILYHKIRLKLSQCIMKQCNVIFLTFVSLSFNYILIPLWHLISPTSNWLWFASIQAFVPLIFPQVNFN